MNGFKKGGKFRKLLPLAMIVVPWFLKDHLATVLEKHSLEAQQVLVAKDNQEQREEQERGIRTLSTELAKIELGQGRNPEEIQHREFEITAGLIQAEGKAMRRSAGVLEGLLKKVDLEEAKRAELAGKAQTAKELGVQLADHTAEALQNATEATVQQWNAVEQGLTAAYEELAVEAEKDQIASADAASMARFVAWIFTAIAAFMMGGWTKLFGMAGEAAP
ncbi:MAG TPA: hypothetical protein VJ505_12560 [Holophagaceae bacterium]|nr:hypothetical protein [Holophagaceae bacterium]